MQARGLGVLITDHNVRETLSVTDRSYIIFEGRVMLSGTAEELVNSPEARRYYLGERFYMDVSRIEQRKRELTHKTSLPPLKANGVEGEPKR